MRVNSYGAAEQMAMEELPIPVCGPNDVLVRTIAAGINPVDWKIRSGAVTQIIPKTLPFTPGSDGAGVVVATGGAVSQFQVGDEVFFYANFARGGSYAEYVAVDASEVAKKPRTLSFASAAALPTPGQAAWTAMLEVARVTYGMRVLVHGGSGALGSIAIQLAKLRGAWVAATASSENMELVKGLGADQVIDYKQQAFQDLVGELDVVLDTIGGATQEASWSTLKPGGVLIATVMPPAPERAQAAGVRASFVFTPPRGEILSMLAEAVDNGHLRVLVGKEFALSDAALAHRHGESGLVRGKMILHVAAPSM